MKTFVLLLLSRGAFGLWNTMKNLDGGPKTRELAVDIDDMYLEVDKLTQEVESAQFELFHPEMSNDEFQETHTGYKSKRKEGKRKKSRSARRARLSGNKGGVDLRESGCLPEVKSQLSCACCYAFVMAAALKYYACKNGDKEPRGFSVEEMAACTSQCNGGHMIDVVEFIEENGGVRSENDVPYTGDLDMHCEPWTFKKFLRPYRIKFLGWPDEVFSRESDIMKQLDLGHPCFVPISVPASVRHYKHGVLTGVACEPKKNRKGEPVVNHIVLCVGYGTDPEWGDYWILMNSWGTEWGEKGFIRVQRDVDCVGVSTETTRLEMKKLSN